MQIRLRLVWVLAWWIANLTRNNSVLKDVNHHAWQLLIIIAETSQRQREHR